MKKVLQFLGHPVFISIVGLILVSLLIWFGGPMIKFGADNTAPLASSTVRLAVIMVILVLWGLNNLRIQMKSKKYNQNLVNDLGDNQTKSISGSGGDQAAEEIQQLNERFSQALATLNKLKFRGRGRKKALYELPWYIIVGPPGSGKTTALVNSGLDFPLAEQFGKGALQGVGGTRNCDWWFTNSAVLIDTAGRYTTQDSHRVIDSSAWEGFLSLLKKHRRRRPINGAIVSISLQDLMIQTEEERVLHAKTIRSRIDELMEKLEVRFPIYLMFTKVDLVSGFREFFEEMGAEERSQVWGLSLPNAPKVNQSPDFEFINKELGVLVSRLYDGVLWRVHQERNIQRRANVYGFPQQMENLKSIIDGFVKQTFVANRFKYQPYLRGVYFSSGTQDGTPIDRLMSSISANFGFSRESSQTPFQQGKSYFLSRLFSDVIFPESELVGANAKYEAFVKWGQRVFFAALAGISAAVLFTWYASVQQSKGYLAEVDQHVVTFNQESERINPWNKDVRVVLPALGALGMASEVYDQEEHPFLTGIGLYDDRVDEEADEAYALQLQKLFLPRLLNSMEDVLALGHEGGDLYNTFRIYMMFDKLERMDKELVQIWFEDLWDTEYPGEATRREELSIHLDNLLALDLEPQELNKQVVSSTRNLLLEVPVAGRVYARIKSDPEFMREVDLLNIFGESARRTFEITPQVQKALKIPFLYTLEGYEAVDFSSESDVLSDVVNERWMLDDEENTQKVDFAKEDLGNLSVQLKELYYRDYIRTWSNLLGALQISELNNLRQANDVLLALVDPVYSPVRSILQISQENTQLTPPIEGLDTVEEKGKGKVKKLGKLGRLAAEKRPVTKVDKHFAELQALMREDRQGVTALDTWLGRIQETQEFVAEVSMAPDPGRRAFEIARSRYQDGSANPIIALKAYAKNAPEPLDKWMTDMATQTWRAVMSSANRHVNAEYRTVVYEPFRFALDGRYPLNLRAADEAALFDFVEFFKPNGVLDGFFNDYMKPFINTNSGWNNRAVDGYSMGFSSDAIRQVRRGLDIKNAFFRVNPESPTIQLDMRPSSMDEEDARFTLDVADTRIVYNHGPKFWKSVTWVGDDDRKRIRVAIEDLDGILHEKSFFGPWAWFKLMDDSSVRKTSRSNVYQITFKVSRSGSGEPRSIVYEGKTKSANSPINAKLISAFKAPESL